MLTPVDLVQTSLNPELTFWLKLGATSAGDVVEEVKVTGGKADKGVFVHVCLPTYLLVC